MEWLGDRVLTHFGRHKAPLLQSHKLAPNEQAFILMSLIPNRKGQPLLVEWRVACRKDDGDFVLESFDGFVGRAGVRAGGLPNRGESAALQACQAQMQQALPAAVESMHTFMLERQQTFSADMQAKLQNTLAELERLQGRQMEQLSLDIEKKLETVKQAHFERGSQKIHKVFDDYRRWVADTLTTEPKPWIQVLAGVCHP